MSYNRTNFSIREEIGECKVNIKALETIEMFNIPDGCLKIYCKNELEQQMAHKLKCTKCKLMLKEENDHCKNHKESIEFMTAMDQSTELYYALNVITLPLWMK